MRVEPHQIKPSFLIHRFTTDAIGHLIASYAAMGMIYVIDNVSHTPSDFNHVITLAFATALILTDYIVARRFGNWNRFGLVALVAASVGGYLLFAIGMGIVEMLRGSEVSLPLSLTFSVLMAPIFLVPAIVAPLIIRLMAYPIIGIFRPHS